MLPTPTRLLLPLSLAVLACAPQAPLDDAGPAPELPDYLPASSYCESIVEPFCPFYLRCGRLSAADLAECRAIFLESCEAKFEPAYVSLEAAGLLRLSRAGFDACAVHLDEVGCALHPRDLDGPCAQMWEGQQAAGESCGFNLESLVCAPGTECSLGLDLCGECRPVVEVDQACGGEVEPAVSCGPNAECEAGRCIARVPLLEACGDEDRCARGSFCIEGICRGPDYVALGQACDGQSRCPFNAHCEGVCVLDNLQGESCANTECASGRCGADQVCEAPAATGAPCQFAFDCASLLCVDDICAEPPSACISSSGS